MFIRGLIVVENKSFKYITIFLNHNDTNFIFMTNGINNYLA